MTFNVEEVLAKLSNAEKSALLSGMGSHFWHNCLSTLS